MCGGGCRDAAVVLTQMLLCGQAESFQTVSRGDRHSPEGWDALGGCARWRGSNVCVSAASELRSSIVGGQEPSLWGPAGQVEPQVSLLPDTGCERFK